MVEGGLDAPGSGVEFPIEVLEKVNDRFEGVVSARFRCGDAVSEIGNKSFVMIFEEKVGS